MLRPGPIHLSVIKRPSTPAKASGNYPTDLSTASAPCTKCLQQCLQYARTQHQQKRASKSAGRPNGTPHHRRCCAHRSHQMQLLPGPTTYAVKTGPGLLLLLTRGTQRGSRRGKRGLPSRKMGGHHETANEAHFFCWFLSLLLTYPPP